MGTKLIIAGHGERQNKSFDPGATGLISKGEHKYMEENLFPAMKKFVPKGADVVFFSAYNVYDRGNLVALANRYGKDTEVIECHFDAAGATASGGHVIVKKGFKPDALDLRLRDAIKANVGTIYSYNGEAGISGRDDLANVNRAANGGVNYRLIEIGFGTNKDDANVMLNKTEQYAKDLVEAILGKGVSGTPKETSKPVSKPAASSSKKSISAVAKEVIAGKWGNGADREAKLKKAGYDPDAVQAEVNKQLGVSSSKPKASSKKSVSTIAKEVIAGKWGNGSDREARLKKAGYNPDAVQAEVNKQLGVGSSKKSSGKSIDQMAKEVIAGKHGSGHENRRKSLGIDKATYEKVRKRVNELM